MQRDQTFIIKVDLNQVKQEQLLKVRRNTTTLTVNVYYNNATRNTGSL